MAIIDAVQTLLAAYFFGILFIAATGVFLLYFKGHGGTIFKDGRRLVLVLFLFFSAFWAQVDFINLLLPLKSSTACQTMLIFSTAADQLARVGIEQFLLWSVGNGSKATVEQLIMQAILGIRFVTGGLFVGFTRPEFASACVARTSVLPIAIVAIALDFIIIGVLIVRVLLFGMLRDFREIRSTTHQEQSKALTLSVAGLFIWSGTSVVMLLGIPSTNLILRTMLPSIGQLVLIVIIAISARALLLPKEEQLTTPEASSPFVTPSPPIRDIFRDVGNGSPISGHNYTKSGSLFVVNPSFTPRDSPTAFQNNQNESRGPAKLGAEMSIRAMGPSDPDQQMSRNAPGYRGSSGVFPSILAASMGASQGALAPQIRSSETDTMRSLPVVPPPMSLQKKSFFNWSKQPQPATVRSLKISNPVMSDSPDPSSQPFARMPTIDLATAAVNERERREGNAARARLIANRPAPRPPLAPQEALRRSVSVKRKEMPNRIQEAMPTIQSSGASGLSVEAANGSTTSASLSPGHEEVRRRSPRNPNSFDQTFSEKNFPRPSLQGTQTLGLPSNPRSQRVTMAREASLAKEQTVMFMNDIVYDDPGMVKTIINGAPEIYAAAKRPKTAGSPTTSYETTLKSSNSIIHRPRPYRRDTEKDRGSSFFLGEASPRHKRSKSGSSITTRKSIFMSHPGSPTQLPPLPAPPTTAAKLTRLLPNDTKSMTFDEKIELLFPAPPGASLIRNRRSSVPSLPRVPSVFISDTPLVQSPTEGEQQSRRASKRTTIASFGLQDFQIPTDERKDENVFISNRETYRFSAITYRTLADEVGETWIPGIPLAETNVRASLQEKPIRDSNTYDMRKSAFTDATSSDESSHDDSTTNWGSIHSEIPPVDLTKAMQNAKMTFIQRPEQSTTSRVLPPFPQEEQDGGEEIMTIMLDSGKPQALSANRSSFFLDANQSLPGDATPKRGEMTWHRRIGDDLPTFSERKKNTRTRKMPPPTPLLLNAKGRNATVVVRAPEPSPMDSPERAIKEIQAQLKRFEEPNRGSVGSLLRHIPDGTNRNEETNKQDDRFRLLENLEKEMGQQETHWQQMQTNLDRDSMSVTMSPPPPLEKRSPGSSQPISRTHSRVISRRARVRSSMNLRSKGQESDSTVSTQSSENSRASVWQQRLAEAQIEYLENAPVLLRNGSMNFLSIAKAQIGSPTPPDSVDSDTDSESDLENGSGSSVSSSDNERLSNKYSDIPSLWQPPLISPKAATGRLWNPPYEVVAIKVSSKPPAMDIRPKQRLVDTPLPTMRGKLWSSKPRTSANSRPVVGLWGSRPVRPRSIVTRPVTQRPQRKSKRVTFLPDIVESPQPLPNKRDTLGIFQFPWGETSDSAVYQPAFNPVLLSHPMLNARLDARSRELEPEPTEYSSSFFDDYDDEFPEEDVEAESDDDFDETTLWEIANLLKSGDIPSKNSLLPAAREIIEDYDDETDFETDSENQTPAGRRSPALQLPIRPLATISKNESKLWANDLASALGAVTTGLPQPDAHVWHSYIPQQDTVRSKSQLLESLPVLTSRDLWASPKAESPVKELFPMWNGTAAAKVPSMGKVIVQEATMWSPKSPEVSTQTSGMYTADAARPIIRRTESMPAAKDIVKAPRAPRNGNLSISSQNLWSPGSEPQSIMWLTKLHFTPSSATLLWTPTPATNDTVITGLFEKTAHRSVFRTTEALPAAIHMVRKARTNCTSLDRLTSCELWNGGEILQDEHHWISESSVRPESPSVYSETSSGRSSPTSDSSSIRSNSTKASSLWSAMSSVNIPAWWDSKSAKKSPDGSFKFTSKVPSGSAHKPLAPVRESRVLASRDMWEAMAPKLEAPVPKFLKSTAPVNTLINRPRLGGPTDWDGALAEAIQAGKPKGLARTFESKEDWKTSLAQAMNTGKPKQAIEPSFVDTADWEATISEAVPASESKKIADLPKTSKSDWEAALSLAISQSRPYIQRPKFSPNSWKMALDEAIKASRIANRVSYDISKRHPVFFTSNFTSTTSDIHPAAIGYVVRVQPVQGMWDGSAAIVSPRAANFGLLWSKGSASKREEFPRFTPSDGAISRKTPVSRSEVLPVLQSTAFWQPPRNVSFRQRHWLSSSSETLLPLTWSPPAKRSMTTPAKTWNPARTDSKEANSHSRVAPSSSADMFAHFKGENTKKASSPRSTGLQRLNSRELFEAPTKIVSQTHWLHATSSVPQVASHTWKPRALVILPEQQSTKMWHSHPAFESQSPTLFSNPHSEPWNRKKRGNSTRVAEIESNSLWRSSTALPTSPNNWLITRRTSRVEFRY